MRYLRMLLASWRQRLARLRAMGADAEDGSSWLWRARARILSFLLSRYGAEDPGLRPVAPLWPAVRAPTVCCVEPCDTPPRAREAIAGVLAALRETNAEARRRLRWRWF